ncbi:MAG TPA: DedA family protein [Gammaproteobacteria bacterium]|nr:DedA family protein [Gammaproteobacteria bacterium]
MEEFIRNFGYAAIFIGTFFEGETVLVVGGFLAHRTYLDLPWVIAAAFFGTLLGDQMYFYLGRVKGVEFLQRRPRWKRKSARVRRLLRRHQTLVVLGFRFLYGVRTVVPFLIGASKVSPLRFLILNVIGALAWASAVGLAGYSLGRTVELFLADVQRYELWILGTLGSLGAAAWSIWWWLQRRQNAESPTS